MWNAANEAGELGVECRSLRNCLGGGELAYAEKGIKGVCGEKEELPWAEVLTSSWLFWYLLHVGI